MPLFKKSRSQERKEHIKFLQNVTSTMELVVKYGEKTEHKERVEIIADEVRYFIPFEKEEIKIIDRKIFNVLDDLKLLIYRNRDPYRVQSKLDEIEILIKERSSKV